jgi:ferredoxin
VASLAHGKAPEFSGERIALTSGATHDSAVSDIVNTADDGETYWGPIDNDSARSKASGETLIIDQWECIQCGTCVENTDSVFTLPDDSKASVINQTGPMDLIQDAIDACPVTCIQWTTEPDSFEQLNDHLGAELS